MNGIAYKCVRGTAKDAEDSEGYQNKLQPGRTNEDIFLGVFKLIDNIFSIIQPRELLYFDIDGVAPHAKMNQLHSRRFRSALKRTEEHTRRIVEDHMYAAADSTSLDSNCISPGTEFTQQLTEALDYYVNERISSNLLWSKIEVVLSGAQAHGEGKHKIMKYSCTVKMSGQMAPNTRHCSCGLYADLILFGWFPRSPIFSYYERRWNSLCSGRRKEARG